MAVALVLLWATQASALLGDIAPLGAPDGVVDIGDAVVALRMTIGLETPTDQALQNGDVAPLKMDANGAAVVDSSGNVIPLPDKSIRIGDAVVLLRASVGLIRLPQKADTTLLSIFPSITPLPNASEWIPANATVSFTCPETTIGIATCSDPVIVTTEGANQVITGTVTDKAGNSASTSVTLNIDKSQPMITTSVSPAPNAAGFHNADPTVTFICSDSISGVATCSDPVTVTTEGMGQVITGTVVDRAGNTASTPVTLHIDKSPPIVHMTSPSNGFSVTVPAVFVEGTVTDIQQITAVTVSGQPVDLINGHFALSLDLPEGSHTLTVSATNIAGNIGTATVSGEVNLPPLVSITQPTNLSVIVGEPTDVTGTVNDPQATVVVNGVLASVGGGVFTASGVPLREGNNVLTAVATDPHQTVGTASVQVVLDTEPPRIAIDSPPDKFVTSTSTITVTGMIDDLGVGTVNAQQATVTVNGVAATVANRAFLASEVLLVAGANTIMAIGSDPVGHTAQATHTVYYQPPVAGQPLLRLMRLFTYR
jgi:hypothetical protein